MLKGVSAVIVCVSQLYACFDKMSGDRLRVAGYQQKVLWAQQLEEILIDTGADLPRGREDCDFGHDGRTLRQAVNRRRRK